MAKLARLLANDRAADAERLHSRTPRLRTRFYAFLSYSHKDKELADWLHRELERFRVPHSLAGKLTANGVVPRRLSPIFRDQQDLSAGADLAEEIKAALAASQFLIVLCSPTAAISRWTNQEIESFKRTRPEGCVLAAVVSGEPFASDLPGREAEECFPPALRYKYDRRGHQTTKRAEPLAADFREHAEGKRLAFLKLVAGMLGVGLDELVQRETTRRHRQLAWLAAGSLAGMAVTSTLAVAAFEARNEAREQRREAEGLVAFMLGDLKDKLEPIGRLDALDGVGSKVLAYYSKQDASELSDAALTQRSKALSLMAQVADARGDSQSSLRLYREAMVATAEEVRRRPTDPQALYDHAQNIFYVGEIDRHRGALLGAESAYRQYEALAERMVTLDPDNMKWRMEVQNAEANIGIALFQQRRFAEAGRQFDQALQAIEALTTADPTNSAYKKSLAESLAWLADTRLSEGQLDEAIRLRERHVKLLRQFVLEQRDVDYRQRLVWAERALGNLFAISGKDDLAVQSFEAAVEGSSALLNIEPDNLQWNDMAARARLNLAEQALTMGRPADAMTQANAGCGLAAGLLGRGPSASEWRSDMRDCLTLRARLAAQSGERDASFDFARRAIVLARSVKSRDPVGDQFGVARALRTSGDVRKQFGDIAGATADWTSAVSTLPSTSERPPETAERAAILRRLGRSDEERPLSQHLAAIGYRKGS